MRNVQPLPTRYHDTSFRSRLEARWAVFFDGCGIEWEYEPEGYDLGDGYYLPDFKLQLEVPTWFEVKPEGWLGVTPWWREGYERLAHGTNSRFALACGIPRTIPPLACDYVTCYETRECEYHKRVSFYSDRSIVLKKSGTSVGVYLPNDDNWVNGEFAWCSGPGSGCGGQLVGTSRLALDDYDVIVSRCGHGDVESVIVLWSYEQATRYRFRWSR